MDKADLRRDVPTLHSLLEPARHVREGHHVLDPGMTEAINFAVAILTLASAILAALYVFARDASPRPQQQSYRRHRPWNFK